MASSLTDPRVIGYFDIPEARDVPRVVTAAVLIDDGTVLAVDIADDLSALGPDARISTEADFMARAALAEVTVISEPIPWHSGSALFMGASSTAPEILQLDDIERRLRQFVTSCRQSGLRALKRDDNSLAREWFDRARRVSNEPDDYVRLWTAELPRMRRLWRDWLSQHAPRVDPIKRAEQLELVPAQAIFPPRLAHAPMAGSTA